MRALVVGMGTQGLKRRKYLEEDFAYSVDKYKKADFKSIFQVPLSSYDTVFLCVPDDEKINLIEYCIKNKKNILVEKPLLCNSNQTLYKLQEKAKKNNVVLYTAYNHRFEPIIIELKKLLKTKKLGKLYRCRIFYGNGTSFLVKKSKWRDKRLGVISDIGSHLIDLCFFWFGSNIKRLKVIEINKFENKSPDHAIISFEINEIVIQLEMTLCMWKNSFSCDLIGSKGSVHLNSLCKWDKNYILFRKRKLPSGKPKESKISFRMQDPTWKLENKYFKDLIKISKKTNLKKDILLNSLFNKINSRI